GPRPRRAAAALARAPGARRRGRRPDRADRRLLASAGGEAAAPPRVGEAARASARAAPPCLEAGPAPAGPASRPACRRLADRVLHEAARGDACEQVVARLAG